MILADTKYLLINNNSPNMSLADGHLTTTSGCRQKNPKTKIKKNAVTTKKYHKKDNIYLTIEVIRKMVGRFLTQTPMSKENLAQALGTSVKKLDQLFYKTVPATLIPAINLPLIKLYCKTRFHPTDQESISQETSTEDSSK